MVDAHPRELMAVFAGGVAGTLARAGMVEAFPHGAAAWPWATLAVNVAGAFALGFLAARFYDRPPPYEHLMSLLGTGVCGALTTFSAMQIELVQMLEADRVGMAAAYAMVSIGSGLLAIVAATRLERALWRAP